MPRSLALVVLIGACGGDSPSVPDAAPSPADAAPDDAAPASADATPDDAAPSPPDAPPAPVRGVRATYFRHHGGAPVLDRIEPTIDAAWGNGGPSTEVGSDHFSVRWTATLDVPAAGAYTFATTTDDGVRVWIGYRAIIDDWTFHAATRAEATVVLPAGPVPLRVEYFDKDYAASARLTWRSDAFPEQVVPTERLAPAPPSAEPAPTPPYDNPVLARDCPDPGVLADGPGGPTYYMVCTGGRFAIRRSADLVLWEDTGRTVLSGQPSWSANGGRNWAPELHRVGDRYIAYFTAVDSADRLAIGAASASSPLGPYVDRGAPLVQDSDGVIDASYFRDDDGRHYLLTKIDGNAHGRPTPIFAQELAADGLSFAAGSSRRQLLVNDAATWEGGVIEAAWLIKRDGMYYLFYSGNVYDGRYRTGVARSSTLLGTYQKRGAPILANNARWVGPGHGSVVHTARGDHFVYHAWPATPSGGHDSAAGRQVLLDRIRWDAGWPALADGSPSRGLEAWPQ